jgi:hypothetical protein
MTLTTLFENDASVYALKDDNLRGISALVQQARVAEQEMAEMEQALKDIKDNYRKLTEEVIPEAMSEIGMKSLKMDDGSSLEIKPFYSASISEARRAEAYQWLRDNGFDDIIKNTVSVRFGRGEDELCSQLLNLLGEKGFPADQAEKIEPMTLKAWVKEMVERGNEFPSELFGAYIGQKAIIKSK